MRAKGQKREMYKNRGKEMNYVWIDEDSADDFMSVLPKELTFTDSHICIGITDEENYICGAICYRYTAYQYDILWLYVVPERRRQGIGSLLVDIVYKVVGRSGDIYPISAMFEADEEDSLYPFFISYDKMDVSYSHDRYILSPKDVYGALLPPEAGKQTLVQTPFFSLSEGVQKRILSRLREDEGYCPDDYDSWKTGIIPQLCRCIIKDDDLKNVVFVHGRPGGNLELSYVYSKNSRGLAEILMATAWDIEDKFPDAKVYFDAVSEDAGQLAKKLFPRKKVVHVYEALW